MELEQAREYIRKAQREFAEWHKRVEVSERYYANDSDIRRTGAAAIDAVNNYLKELGNNPLRSADNRIPTNWHEILTVQKVAYLFTFPPIFTVGQDDELSKDVKKALGDEYKKVMTDLATYATNGGKAWLQYWVDTSGKFRMAALRADECVKFTDPMDISRPMIALVRRYTLEDSLGQQIPHYQVWDKDGVLYLKGGQLEAEELMIDGEPVTGLPNDFGEIPVIEFCNNDKEQGDLPKYKELIDMYDKVISGFANDLDDIQEIVWVLKDYTGENEQTISIPQRDEEGNILYDEDGDPFLKQVNKPVNLLQQIKAQKYVTVDENGGLDKLSIEIPHEARDAALTILQKQIYISGMGVDPNPERTGQATGAYVDHLYSLLELKAGMMQAQFEVALNKLVRAILAHLGRTDDLTIEQTWTRNKPKVDNEIVERLNSTPSTVMSDYTKRRKHPDIDDPDAEDELVKKEQEEALQNMMDSFGQPQEVGNEQ